MWNFGCHKNIAYNKKNGIRIFYIIVKIALIFTNFDFFLFHFDMFWHALCEWPDISSIMSPCGRKDPGSISISRLSPIQIKWA